MQNNQKIKEEILKLVIEAITITKVKESEIFVLEDELGNIKFFNSSNKKFSHWLYCDTFTEVIDNLLLLKCKYYGDRFLNLTSFKISTRFSEFIKMKQPEILLLKDQKNGKFKLLNTASFISTEWLDFDLFDEDTSEIHLKEKTYVILDQDSMKIFAL